MAEYSISPGIITSSLNELKIIQTWTEEFGKNSEKPDYYGSNMIL